MLESNESNALDSVLTSKPEPPLPTSLFPQFAEDGITEADIQTAVKVLEAAAKLHPKFNRKRRRPQTADPDEDKRRSTVDGDGKENVPTEEGATKGGVKDGLSEYQRPNMRTLRKALAGVFEVHKLLLFNGKSEEQHYRDRTVERSIKRQKMAERMTQKKYIADTELRRGRVEKFERLKMDAADEENAKLQRFMIPDGHVDTVGGDTSVAMITNGDEKGEEAKMDTGIKLPNLRSCYVCKVRFRDLHSFYDQLCPGCAKLNFEKRHFSVSLKGKIAVVTGARVKIGLQVCLKLLRSGCTVVATTRFPNSAAATYRNEADFNEWKDRLNIFGLDLRDVVGMEAFTRFMKLRFPENGIDILINNACQTVRRPTAYYKPILEKETSLWKEADDMQKALLSGCISFERIRRQLSLDQQQGTNSGTASIQPLHLKEQDLPLLSIKSQQSDSNSSIVENDSSADACLSTGSSSTLVDGHKSPFEGTGLSHSAAMSQMVILPDDVGVPTSVLPPGLSDINGQQLDLRTSNSWLLKIGQVSTPELMECMFINAIAPFVMNSRLLPLMNLPNTDNRPDRYIINVSAMEGKFYRYKMPNHPHTNMAKAALNMLTRTSSQDMAETYRIYMNSVDTGWINDENPLEKASKIAKANHFQTPIDEIDAASRILDPIFVGVAMDTKTELNDKSTKEYGKFYKDYKETEW